MKDYAIGNNILWRYAIAEPLILTKPGIVSLVLMSTLTGLCIGSRGMPDIWLTLWVITGVGLATAGSAVLNNYFDRNTDRLMERTYVRALAVESFSPGNTLTLGIVLALTGILILNAYVNSISSALTAVAVVVYVIFYTILLKRRTSFANQIGGIAGALPPVIGYAAITNRVDLNALILLLIVAIWQQPHALSIALKYRKEYARASIPVVPVAKGISSTKKRILLYTALLLIISAVPYLYGMAGLFYLSISMLLGIYYVILSVRFLLSERGCDMFLFSYSIIYITSLFALMILDIT